MLDSVEDTVGLFLLEMGVDPSGTIEPAAFDEAIARSRRPWTTTKSASSRATTTQGCRQGRRVGVCRLVGDIIILQPDNPNLKFVILDAGGMTSVDTMVIPTGGDVYTASTFMNFFYDPEVAAKVTAYVNYITPVKGTKEAITKIDPARQGPAHLPDAPEVLEKPSTSSTSEAIENPEYQEKWQAVIGVQPPPASAHVVSPPPPLADAVSPPGAGSGVPRPVLRRPALLPRLHVPSGDCPDRLHVQLGLGQLLGRLQHVSGAVFPFSRVRGNRNARRAPHLLSPHLLDRPAGAGRTCCSSSSSRRSSSRT